MDGTFITHGGLLVYLLFAAGKDIRTRKVSTRLAQGAVWAAVLLWIFFRPMGLAEWVFGLLPGLFVLLVGCISGEAIGYGDGIVTLVCGLFLGFWGCLQVLVFGLFFSGPVSLYLICSGRAHRKSRIPFVPFLVLGYIGWLVMRM